MNQLKAKQFISAMFESATTIKHLDLIVHELKELAQGGNLYFYIPIDDNIWEAGYHKVNKKDYVYSKLSEAEIKNIKPFKRSGAASYFENHYFLSYINQMHNDKIISDDVLIKLVNKNKNMISIGEIGLYMKFNIVDEDILMDTIENSEINRMIYLESDLVKTIMDIAERKDRTNEKYFKEDEVATTVKEIRKKSSQVFSVIEPDELAMTSIKCHPVYATSHGIYDDIFFKISDLSFNIKMTPSHFFVAFSNLLSFSTLNIKANDFKNVMNQIDFYANKYLESGKNSVRVNEKIINLMGAIEEMGFNAPSSLTEVFNRWCLKQKVKEENKYLPSSGFDNVLAQMKSDANSAESVKTKAMRVV